MKSILLKVAGVSVAGFMTLGGGWAFAEVAGEQPPAEETVTTPTEEETVVTPPAEEEVVVIAPAEEETVVITPVEEEVVVTSPVEEVVVTTPPAEEEVVEVVVEEPVAHVHPENHGKYVSETAKSAPKGKGGVHGKAVSEVARSDQGKKQAPEAEETASTTSATKAHGKSKK